MAAAPTRACSRRTNTSTPREELYHFAGRLGKGAVQITVWSTAHGAALHRFAALQEGDILRDGSFLVHAQRELDKVACLQEAGAVERRGRHEDLGLTLAHNEAIALADVVPFDHATHARRRRQQNAAAGAQIGRGRGRSLRHGLLAPAGGIL